ncbi:unnamed protein product, partial [Rotaria sp. Silwood1]
KIIEQSKSDLNILHKYYCYLQSYNQQLQQLISFKSLEHNEYLNSQSISNRCTNFQNQLRLEMKKNFNHIHYWHIFMISAPDKFNNISKLFLLKKKFVHKTNELINLKKIFYEKETLYRYIIEKQFIFMADEGFVVDPYTGEQYNVGGCLVSDEPSDLPTFGAASFVQDEELPYTIDLRQFMTPIENQRKTGSWLVYRNCSVGNRSHL